MKESTKKEKKRLMLKLSGEILGGRKSNGLDPDKLISIAEDICNVFKNGKQVCIVVGGGNIFRGVALGAAGMDRATADYMGMLATVMNALALQDAMTKANIVCRVQSAIKIEQVVEPYIRGKAIQYLEDQKQLRVPTN